MDEFEIIADIFAPLARDPGAFGLTDDAAAIAARPGFDLIVTTDQIAEGADFFAFDPPAQIAQKALRVNLSDLAAKGAKPEYYLLALTMPPGFTREWLSDFASGLKADQDRFGVSLIGGDTSRGEILSIAVTAFGFVPQGKMIKRASARVGDAVYVTDMIGDSGGGLAIFRREKHTLSEKQRDYLTGRYRLPEPPVTFGAALRGLATASVDVSDGLVADLGHVASASGVRIEIDAEVVPRSPALRAFWGDDANAILRAVTAGDDYQIAFTADSSREKEILAAAGEVPVTRIGRVMAGEGTELRYAGKALGVPHTGYRHF